MEVEMEVDSLSAAPPALLPGLSVPIQDAPAVSAPAPTSMPTTDAASGPQLQEQEQDMYRMVAQLTGLRLSTKERQRCLRAIAERFRTVLPHFKPSPICEALSLALQEESSFSCHVAADVDAFDPSSVDERSQRSALCAGLHRTVTPEGRNLYLLARTRHVVVATTFPNLLAVREERLRYEYRGLSLSTFKLPENSSALELWVCAADSLRPMPEGYAAPTGPLPGTHHTPPLLPATATVQGTWQRLNLALPRGVHAIKLRLWEEAVPGADGRLPRVHMGLLTDECGLDCLVMTDTGVAGTPRLSLHHALRVQPTRTPISLAPSAPGSDDRTLPAPRVHTCAPLTTGPSVARPPCVSVQVPDLTTASAAPKSTASAAAAAASRPAGDGGDEDVAMGGEGGGGKDEEDMEALLTSMQGLTVRTEADDVARALDGGKQTVEGEVQALRDDNTFVSCPLFAPGPFGLVVAIPVYGVLWFPLAGPGQTFPSFPPVVRLDGTEARVFAGLQALPSTDATATSTYVVATTVDGSCLTYSLPHHQEGAVLPAPLPAPEAPLVLPSVATVAARATTRTTGGARSVTGKALYALLDQWASGARDVSATQAAIIASADATLTLTAGGAASAAPPVARGPTKRGRNTRGDEDVDSKEGEGGEKEGATASKRARSRTTFRVRRSMRDAFAGAGHNPDLTPQVHRMTQTQPAVLHAQSVLDGFPHIRGMLYTLPATPPVFETVVPSAARNESRDALEAFILKQYADLYPARTRDVLRLRFFRTKMQQLVSELLAEFMLHTSRSVVLAATSALCSLPIPNSSESGLVLRHALLFHDALVVRDQVVHWPSAFLTPPPPQARTYSLQHIAHSVQAVGSWVVLQASADGRLTVFHLPPCLAPDALPSRPYCTILHLGSSWTACPSFSAGAVPVSGSATHPLLLATGPGDARTVLAPPPGADGVTESMEKYRTLLPDLSTEQCPAPDALCWFGAGFGTAMVCLRLVERLAVRRTLFA